MTTMDETVIMIRHIFLGKRIVIFFSCSFFCLLVLSVVFFISRYSCTLFFIHAILKSAFVEKKCRKCSSSTSKVDCHKMMIMIRRASRGYRERFYDERECDIFRSSLSSRPRGKKQHCHLRFADVLLLKKDSEESIASILAKKMVLPARMNFFPRCLRIDATFSLRR